MTLWLSLIRELTYLSLLTISLLKQPSGWWSIRSLSSKGNICRWYKIEPSLHLNKKVSNIKNFAQFIYQNILIFLITYYISLIIYYDDVLDIYYQNWFKLFLGGKKIRREINQTNSFERIHWSQLIAQLNCKWMLVKTFTLISTLGSWVVTYRCSLPFTFYKCRNNRIYLFQFNNSIGFETRNKNK